MVKLNRAPRYYLLELQGRQIFTDPPAMRAHPPAKPARHSPEAKPMADGKGEAAWGTSGQVCTDDMIIHSLETLKICAICVQKYSCSTILLR